MSVDYSYDTSRASAEKEMEVFRARSARIVDKACAEYVAIGDDFLKKMGIVFSADKIVRERGMRVDGFFDLSQYEDFYLDENLPLLAERDLFSLPERLYKKPLKHQEILEEVQSMSEFEILTKAQDMGDSTAASLRFVGYCYLGLGRVLKGGFEKLAPLFTAPADGAGDYLYIYRGVLHISPRQEILRHLIFMLHTVQSPEGRYPSRIEGFVHLASLLCSRLQVAYEELSSTEKSKIFVASMLLKDFPIPGGQTARKTGPGPQFVTTIDEAVEIFARIFEGTALSAHDKIEIFTLVPRILFDKDVELLTQTPYYYMEKSRESDSQLANVLVQWEQVWESIAGGFSGNEGVSVSDIPGDIIYSMFLAIPALTFPGPSTSAVQLDLIREDVYDDQGMWQGSEKEWEKERVNNRECILPLDRHELSNILAIMEFAEEFVFSSGMEKIEHDLDSKKGGTWSPQKEMRENALNKQSQQAVTRNDDSLFHIPRGDSVALLSPAAFSMNSVRAMCA